AGANEKPHVGARWRAMLSAAWIESNRCGGLRASPAPSPQSSPGGKGGHGQHVVLVLSLLNPYHCGFDPSGWVVHRSWQDGKCGRFPRGSTTTARSVRNGRVRLGSAP